MALNILLSRTDNLGDVVYSLPLATLLKKHYPDARVSLLARDYAKSLIQSNPDIDEMISWDALQKADSTKQQATLKPYDIFINVLACKETAKLAYKAGIKTRIGTFGRWYHWRYCNRLAFLTRAKSHEHEICLNTKLLKPLNIKAPRDKHSLQSLIELHANPQQNAQAYLSSETFNLIIHPASNGSGREWPTENYIELITALKERPCHVILTGGPNDRQKVQTIHEACPWVTNSVGKTTLNDLLFMIERADGLIAAGTGPLHIASSMNKKVIGLFPMKKNIGPERWAPLGEHAQALTQAETGECRHACSNSDCPCMIKISSKQVLNAIKDWF